MCGRYSLSKSKEELEQRFQAEMLSELKPRYNIAPTQLVPVVTSQSPKGFSYFYWGITPEFGKNRPVAQKLINAKAEIVNEKISLKTAFRQRRCIIPADGFYEWKRLGKKTSVPYRFTLRDDELFSFAGIWEEYEAVNGDTQHTFLIITTTPNAVVSEINDRMPVILDQSAEKKWLDKYAEEDDLLNLLNPYPADSMLAYTVSPLVNSVENDSPSLIRKTSPVDQHGNYTLFG
ncbi:SOS response-associated peptidase [Algoriphagus sp. Y33]|uniref:SOS response-associated peptidase n=1 Tax=Algoriphagus sp. Y33 TaxID=2772483 RepID=UPI00177E2132|nr:SOS response-associated peptidase [Algoriphagus sp. Y33]